jgi:hypothetical protein
MTLRPTAAPVLRRHAIEMGFILATIAVGLGGVGELRGRAAALTGFGVLLALAWSLGRRQPAVRW